MTKNRGIHLVCHYVNVLINKYQQLMTCCRKYILTNSQCHILIHQLKFWTKELCANASWPWAWRIWKWPPINDFMQITHWQPHLIHTHYQIICPVSPEGAGSDTTASLSLIHFLHWTTECASKQFMQILVFAPFTLDDTHWSTLSDHRKHNLEFVNHTELFNAPRFTIWGKCEY